MCIEILIYRIGTSIATKFPVPHCLHESYRPTFTMCLITSRGTEEAIPYRRVYRDRETGAFFRDPEPRRSFASSTGARSVRWHSSHREVRHVYAPSPYASHVSTRSVRGGQPGIVIPGGRRSLEHVYSVPQCKRPRLGETGSAIHSVVLLESSVARIGSFVLPTQELMAGNTHFKFLPVMSSWRHGVYSCL
jgi:hypothetical protein